jgi:hypothetical protein
VLAPGLRLGYVVAPRAVFDKLLQAKQAADLHTPGFNQRIVHEVVRDGFLRSHVPTIRARYKRQRDAMEAALAAHLPSAGPSACRWRTPGGGMFFWVELPAGVDSQALLVRAVERGVAFVPGTSFFCGPAPANTLRLSFVTVAPDTIERGIAALGAACATYGSPRDDPLRLHAGRCLHRHAAARQPARRRARCRRAGQRTHAGLRALDQPERDDLPAAPRPAADPTTGSASSRPGGELPVRGHPDARQLPCVARARRPPKTAGTVVQECGIGPVRLRLEGARAAFRAPRLEQGEVDAADRGAVLEALGVPPASSSPRNG